MVDYRALDVPVDGGTLRVGVWGDDADPPILAIHGVTSSHRAWVEVAGVLAGTTRVVAPDLRGRGASHALPAPYGMAAHADDMARVLDAVGIDRATVVGHSMGGFVAVTTAARHSDRVERLLLLDGGLPLPPAPGVDPEERIEAVIGAAFARLDMTFASREDYRAFWRRHPALGPYWIPSYDDYADYDLGGTEPALRSRVSKDAVRVDSRDVFTPELTEEALAASSAPATFLRAERGLFDEPTPLYAEDVAAEAAQRHGIAWRTLAGFNHYTMVMSPAGAAEVAAVVTAGGSA
jgi:pimeloyl-ACP methyl ester carboxylesterase